MDKYGYWKYVVLIAVFLVSSLISYTFFYEAQKKKEQYLIATFQAKEQEATLSVIQTQVLSKLDVDTLYEDVDHYIYAFQKNLSILHYGGIIEGKVQNITLHGVEDREVETILIALQASWREYQEEVSRVIHQSLTLPPLKRQRLRNFLDDHYRDLHTFNEKLIEKLSIISEAKTFSEKTWMWCTLASVFGFLLSLLLTIRNVFYEPTEMILKIVRLVSKGVLSQKVIYYPNNRIGMIGRALDRIIINQQTVSETLEKIGDANFNIDYKKVSEDDQLGGTIEIMRTKLHNFFEEDKRKSFISNWTNEGVAKFAEILRNNTDDIEELSDVLLSSLVKYIDGNQGAVYLLEKNELNESCLSLISVYAWKRKKHLEQSIEIGEGVLGQAVLEKEIVYITDVPDNYVNITSGLGDANPSSLIIVPLKVNEEVLGVIELASFKEYDSYVMNFLEKVAESFAASVSSVRANENTKKLLKESQELTEALKAQEEELRHNAEELQATQEDINKNLELIDLEKKKNTAILETCADGVIVFNDLGIIEFFNEAAENIWNRKREDVLGQEVTLLASLGIDHKDHVVSYLNGDRKIPIGVRTEISVDDAFGEEIPVLITISDNQIGSSCVYAAFVQSIAVELF